jgi:hypothetical protein
MNKRELTDPAETRHVKQTSHEKDFIGFHELERPGLTQSRVATVSGSAAERKNLLLPTKELDELSMCTQYNSLQ